MTMPVGLSLGTSSTCSARPSTTPTSRPRRWPIHRHAPSYDQLEPKTEMFVTGIKVIDLLEPYVAGGKIGMFGGAGSARRWSSRR